MVLEVCVDSIISAKNAASSGVERIELCHALSEGGLTPSYGLFKAVKRALKNSKTKIFCMIRIRRGNFYYSDEEIEAMIEDVKLFKHEADGIVFGLLQKGNQIDVKNCQKIISAWGHDNSSSISFHRAFDETNIEDIEKNIEILSKLGFSRILTSGFESSAALGIKNLQRMATFAASLERSISIMPGAGINGDNVEKILIETGCREIHASARSEMKSGDISKLSMGGGKKDLEPLMVCDPIKVKEIIQIVKMFKNVS